LLLDAKSAFFFGRAALSHFLAAPTSDMHGDVRKNVEGTELEQL
jgi:hypothetical protein